MAERTIAIGDIHGCSTALSALVEAIAPNSDDTIVTLGDYIDRGMDSKGVLVQLIALADRCRLIPILGNHDEMMLHARDGRSDFQFWMECGGVVALDSYGSSGRLNLVPDEHFRFLQSCLPYYETDTHIFVHANYIPELPLAKQDGKVIRWRSLRDYVPDRHVSGKITILGHTPHPEILDLGHLKCIDTGCCDGGWLSALDVSSGQVLQVDERGMKR